MIATLTAADLVYDSAAHRTTTPDGCDVPHVTAILSAVGVSTNFEDLAQLSPRLEEQIRYRCALGSSVHDYAHAYDDNDLDWTQVDPRVEPYLTAWADCRENAKLLPLTRERRVFHPVAWFTGILDGIFLHEATGKRILADLKIGDPADAAAEFQTAAYEAAWLIEHPTETIDERWAIRLCPDLQIPYRITNYSARAEAWRDFQKFQAFVTTYHEQAVRRRRIA